jgi:hypothetical protein
MNRGVFGDRSGFQRTSLFKFVSGSSSGVKKQQREADNFSVPISEVNYICGSMCSFP